MQDKKALYLEWIKFAETDLNAAKTLIEQGDLFLNIVIFLSQQGCEKAIKACLIKFEIQHRKTHDLQSLLVLLEEKDFFSTKLYEAIEIFEKFSVEIRYPDGDIFPTREEAQLALSKTEFIINFISEIVKK